LFFWNHYLDPATSPLHPLCLIVSILVFLEPLLRHYYFFYIHLSLLSVSILVFLEPLLRPIIVSPFARPDGVSILVFLEPLLRLSLIQPHL